MWFLNNCLIHQKVGRNLYHIFQPFGAIGEALTQTTNSFWQRDPSSKTNKKTTVRPQVFIHLPVFYTSAFLFPQVLWKHHLAADLIRDHLKRQVCVRGRALLWRKTWNQWWRLDLGFYCMSVDEECLLRWRIKRYLNTSCT